MSKTPSTLELNLLSPIEWVKEERRRQSEARGEQNHNCYKWMAILGEELGEVFKIIEERTEYKVDQEEYTRNLQYELIQTAAVAVAWVEAIRRKEGTEQDPKCVCISCNTHMLEESKNDKA